MSLAGSTLASSLPWSAAAQAAPAYWLMASSFETASPAVDVAVDVVCPRRLEWSRGQAIVCEVELRGERELDGTTSLDDDAKRSSGTPDLRRVAIEGSGTIAFEEEGACPIAGVLVISRKQDLAPWLADVPEDRRRGSASVAWAILDEE